MASAASLIAGSNLFAARIDDGLKELFSQHVEGSLGGAGSDWRPEITFLVSASYYLLSVLPSTRGKHHEGTPGMTALGLSQRIIAATATSPTASLILSYLLPADAYRRYLPLALITAVYLYQRLRRISSTQRWSAEPPGSLPHSTYKRLQALELVGKLLGLGSAVAALSLGTFPNPIYPLSGLSVVPSSTSSSASDAVVSSTEALGPLFRGLQPLIFIKYHQLLWQSLRGVLFTGLLEQLRRAQRAVERRAMRAARYIHGLTTSRAWWSRGRVLGGAERSTSPPPRFSLSSLLLRSPQRVLTPPGQGRVADADAASGVTDTVADTALAGGGSGGGGGGSADDALEPCAVCQASPAESPHVPECGHVFCYVCLQKKLLRFGGTSEGGSDGGSRRSTGSTSRLARTLQGIDANAGSHYSCPVCGLQATTCARWVPPPTARGLGIEQVKK